MKRNMLPVVKEFEAWRDRDPKDYEYKETYQEFISRLQTAPVVTKSEDDSVSEKETESPADEDSDNLKLLRSHLEWLAETVPYLKHNINEEQNNRTYIEDFAKRDDLVDYAGYKEFRYKKMDKEFDEWEEKWALTRKEFLNKLIKTRAIHSLVSYNDKGAILDVSVDCILLHIEKKKHSTVVVESINRGAIAKVNPSVLDANLLWPGYYLANRPKDGKPLSSLVTLFNTEDEVVEQYWARKDKGIRLSGDLLVLAPKNFGDKYADACMDEKNLAALSDPMFEGWEPHMLSIHQPGVCLLGNTEKLVLGYGRYCAIPYTKA